MESYAFRPKQTGLPKLTNSTFYKTLKSAKTKNNYAIDLNIQIYQILITHLKQIKAFLNQ